MVSYKSLGISPEELDNLTRLGIKYDKRTKKQMLAAHNYKEKQDIDEINNYASTLGGAFPVDYANFLSIKNGGKPEPSTLNFSKKSISIKYMYAYKSPLTTCTLDYALALYQGRIPKGFIPIAHDSAGNLLIMSFLLPESGHVYFWDHNNEVDESEQPYFGNMVKICESFSLLESMLE